MSSKEVSFADFGIYSVNGYKFVLDYSVDRRCLMFYMEDTVSRQATQFAVENTGLHHERLYLNQLESLVEKGYYRLSPIREKYIQKMKEELDQKEISRRSARYV